MSAPPFCSDRSRLSERDIRAAERAADKRIYSAQDRHGRFHRPDLVLLGEQSEAIEVELTPKPPRRLAELIRAWRREVRSGTVAEVRYPCGNRRTRRAIERVAAKIPGTDFVTIGWVA